MTDKLGNILWQDDFTPFGEETGESGFQDRDGFYTGKKIDRDTGLYYFNARWYDPQLGRFITEDPIKDGVNWHGYANQNPMTMIDPTGLSADDYQYSNMMSGNSDGSEVENDNTYSYGETSTNSGNNRSGSGNNNSGNTPEGPILSQADADDLKQWPKWAQFLDEYLSKNTARMFFGSGPNNSVMTMEGRLIPMTENGVWPASERMQHIGLFAAEALLGVNALNKAAVLGPSTFTIRQQGMLADDVGYNVSPESWFDEFDSIGRNGTYITDRKAIVDAVGDFTPGFSNSTKQAVSLEKALGLNPGSLGNGFRITEVNSISGMAPRSPVGGANEFFLGGGQGLPGGGPEMIINSILTK